MTYDELEQLKQHYGVQTIQELMDCLTKHIEILQARLNAMEGGQQHASARLPDNV